MAWDDNLTTEQKAAACHNGPARLLAGPGTGKTFCTVRHVLYLAEVEGVPTEQILVLTFTRAAAAELRSRLRSELGGDRPLPCVATLHSFALSTLLDTPGGRRFPTPIRIADDFEERRVVWEDLKRLLALKQVREVAKLFDQLSADWAQLTGVGQQRDPNPRFLGAWQEHRQRYGYILRCELVYQLKLALDQGEAALRPVPAHIVVDEYQDLNACDLAVVHALADAGAVLYVAGDDDQSIYGFRQADPEGIRSFLEQCPAAAGLQLTECKRCDRDVLRLGLYVADQDYRRIRKDIHPSVGAQAGEVRILRFRDQYAEARGVASVCKWLHDTQGVPLGRILLLLRADHNRQFSRPIQQALLDVGVASAVATDPLSALNCPKDEQGNSHPAGRVLLAHLRLLVNRCDSLAWRTILELTRSGVGSATLSGLYDIAGTKGGRFGDVVSEVARDPSLLPSGGAAVSRAVTATEQLLKTVSDIGLEQVSSVVAALSSSLVADETERASVAACFEPILDQAPDLDLERLLSVLSTSLGSKEQDRDESAVNILTMHQAKGLTADAVFVVAAEEENIPGPAQGRARDDEMRLLYVSLTRARHYLFVTHCASRCGPQQHTGSRRGQPGRRLTTFLSGGPVQSEDGTRFVEAVSNGSE